jgi:hypothetical protein
MRQKLDKMIADAMAFHMYTPARKKTIARRNDMRIACQLRTGHVGPERPEFRIEWVCPEISKAADAQQFYQEPDARCAGYEFCAFAARESPDADSTLGLYVHLREMRCGVPKVRVHIDVFAKRNDTLLWEHLFERTMRLKGGDDATGNANAFYNVESATNFRWSNLIPATCAYVHADDSIHFAVDIRLIEF